MSRSLTYAERHARAAESFEIFARGNDPERTAAGFAGRYGALGSAAFDVVGAMWARPELSRRDRSLLVIATLAAQARDEELTAHTAIGLRNGLTQAEIEEIPLQVAAFAGFPAAMASIRRIDEGLKRELGVETLPRRAPATPTSDAERAAAAAEALQHLAGSRDGDGGLDEARLGEVAVTARLFAYGDVWSRPQLSPRDRSIAAISILVSLGAQRELAQHVRGGLNHGLTRAEIEEIVNHLTLYAGAPRAIDAIATVRSTFEQLEATA
jgi:4-carboxymuconolactone decarboxylase